MYTESYQGNNDFFRRPVFNSAAYIGAAVGYSLSLVCRVTSFAVRLLLLLGSFSLCCCHSRYRGASLRKQFLDTGKSFFQVITAVVGVVLPLLAHRIDRNIHLFFEPLSSEKVEEEEVEEIDDTFFEDTRGNLLAAGLSPEEVDRALQVEMHMQEVDRGRQEGEDLSYAQALALQDQEEEVARRNAPIYVPIRPVAARGAVAGDQEVERVLHTSLQEDTPPKQDIEDLPHIIEMFVEAKQILEKKEYDLEAMNPNDLPLWTQVAIVKSLFLNQPLQPEEQQLVGNWRRRISMQGPIREDTYIEQLVAAHKGEDVEEYQAFCKDVQEAGQRFSSNERAVWTALLQRAILD